MHAAFSDARDAVSSAGSTHALTSSAISGVTITALYPGATGDVRLAISNPKPYPVRVTDIALDGTDANIAPDAGHPGCTTTGVSFRHNGRVSIDIAAHGIVETTLDDAVAMSNASVDGCQGATFTMPVILRAANTP